MRAWHPACDNPRVDVEERAITMTQSASHASIPPPPAADPRLAVRPPGERRNVSLRQQLVSRLAGEFAEMPCLSLTLAQSMRLFDVREDICRRILDSLVAEGTLWKRADGRYAGREPLR
jgi:hypothetical protein